LVARHFRFGVAIAGLFLIALPTRPVGAQTGNTALIVSGPQDEPITLGGSFYYLPTDGTFTLNKLSNPFEDGIWLVFQEASPQVQWDLTFSAPNGQLLQVADYENCQRGPGDTTGGLDVSGFGTGCDHLSGSFIVHELVRDVDGNIQAFHISFQQSCFGTYPPLAGEIFYNSSHQLPPAPMPAPTARPGQLSVISVSVSPKQIVEGSDAIFTFTANPAPPLPLTVGITEQNLGPRQVTFGGPNFISFITFGAGVSTHTVTLHTFADTEVQKKQRFTVQILKVPIYKIGRPKSATVRIGDPPP
jgi:hypothetical protein